MHVWPAFLSLGLLFGLAGCGLPGPTHIPAEADEVLPVTFYGGHVLSVQLAAIGSADGAIGITEGYAPGVVLGVAIGPGLQPGDGRVGVAVLGEAPAWGLEYTVAVNNTPQVVQITQYILPEDYAAYPNGVIPPRTPVVIRVVGAKARVFPLSMIPPEDSPRIARGPLPLPLGAPTEEETLRGRLASPPHHLGKFARCFDPAGRRLDCGLLLGKR